MKKLLVSLAAAFLIAVVACRSNGPTVPMGTPDPPFEGEPPTEPYVYSGEIGAYGGSMVLSLPDDPKTFNIIRATETASADVLWVHVFRCLVDYRNGGDPPGYDAGLCTKWEASPDAKAWTFYLRKGVRWSDGEPFTADDVVFSYDVVRDPDVDTPVKPFFQEGKDAAGKDIYPDVERIDDHTVRFNLHTPNGGFLDSMFNLFLIPKHKWEQAWRAGKFKETMKLSDDPKEVVGLGPYRIKEYVSGQRVVLERNPFYWKVDRHGNRLPYLDRLVFVIVKDFTTVPAKFEAGEVDVMTRVRAQDYVNVKKLEGPNITLHEVGISYDTNWLILNQNTGSNPKTGKPYVEPRKLRLFRDQRFRQAVSYAINRQGIADTVYVGRGVPIYSFVSPGDPIWYSDDIMKFPYDAGRARQMLAEVGLRDSNGDGLLEDAEGHSVEISITVNASNSQRVESANFIARNLRDVGIKVNVNPVSIGVIADMLETNFDFDAIVLGWQVNPPPGPGSSTNILLSSGLSHACFPSQKSPSTEWEARIDQLVAEITATPDTAQRKKLYGEIQRIWSEQLPEINLISQREAVAYWNKFGNLRPSALQPRITWNVEEIYAKQQ